MDINLLDYINKQFGCDGLIPNETAPLILAYIGDAYYEVLVRTVIISKGNRPIAKIHKDSIKLVNAGLQASLSEALMEDFTEEELNIYKRGRNAKANTSAKNASLGDYRKATGFEAVIGYLYLSKKEERIAELVRIGFEKLNINWE